MPGAKNDLINVYSLRDIDLLGQYCGMVLYDILDDELDEETKLDLFSRASLFDIYRLADAKKFIKAYGDKFPMLSNYNQELLDDGVRKDQIDQHIAANAVGDRTDYNKTNPYEAFEAHNSKKYTEKAFNEAFSYMLDAVREIGKHLDRYIKKKNDTMSNNEKLFVGMFKRLLDDYGTPTGVHDKILSDPLYEAFFNEVTAGYAVNKVTVISTYDSKENEFRYEVAGRHDTNYKNIVTDMGDTILFKTIAKESEILSKEDEYYKSGDVNRQELTEEYKKFMAFWDERNALTPAEFDVIHAKGYLQNPYDQYIGGRRSPRFAEYDTEARIKLLEAGYPMSDILALARVYYLINELKYSYDNEQPKREELIENYNDLKNAFDDMVNNTPLTKQLRDTNLKKMRSALLTCYEPDGAYSGIYGKILGGMNERIKAKLSAEDEMLLGGAEHPGMSEFEYLYSVVSRTDESKIPSSSEFRKMKETLRKLSEVDKDNNPDRYEALKHNAIKAAKTYIDYKKNQYRAGGHKRSDYEKDRVMAANNVYDRLLIIDRADGKKAHDLAAADADNNLSPEEALNLVETIKVIGMGRKKVIDKLEQLKEDLRNTQQNKDYNFTNTDKSEGSAYYTDMTKSLQESIDVLKNERSTPRQIKRVLTELAGISDTYYHERTGAKLSKGKKRLELAKNIEECARSYILCYDTERVNLDRYKDKYGNPYMSKSFKSLSEISNRYIDRYNGNDIFVLCNDDHYKLENSGFEILSANLEKLRLEVKKACPYIADRYTIDKGPDYYAGLKDGISVEELADIYVGKKYLDKIYDRESFDPQQFNADKYERLKEQIDPDIIKREVAKLAKNPVFKAYAAKNPAKCISDWMRLQSKADEIKEIADNFIEDMRIDKDGNPYKNDRAAIWGSKEDIITAASRYAVNKLLTGEKGAVIRDAIAADTSKEPSEFIEELVYTTYDLVYKDTHKGVMNPAFYVLDDENYGKIYENILNNSWKIAMETTPKSKNFVYKALAGNDQEANMQEWARVNEKAKEIQANCKAKVKEMMTDKDGKPYQSESFAVYIPVNRKLTDEDDVTLASKLIVNRIISENGKLIAQAIAADRSTEPERFIDMLVHNTKELILSKTNDGRSNRGDYAFDSDNFGKIYDNLLNHTKKISHIDRLNSNRTSVKAKPANQAGKAMHH